MRTSLLIAMSALAAVFIGCGGAEAVATGLDGAADRLDATTLEVEARLQRAERLSTVWLEALGTARGSLEDFDPAEETQAVHAAVVDGLEEIAAELEAQAVAAMGDVSRRGGL